MLDEFISKRWPLNDKLYSYVKIKFYGLIVRAWACYLSKNGEFSCLHMNASGQLTNSNSMPKLELHSVSLAAKLKSMLEASLEQLINKIRAGSGSSVLLGSCMTRTSVIYPQGTEEVIFT